MKKTVNIHMFSRFCCAATKMPWLAAFCGFVFLFTSFAKLIWLVRFPQDIPKIPQIIPPLMGRQTMSMGMLMDIVLFVILFWRLFAVKSWAIVGYLMTLAMIVYHVLTLYDGTLKTCSCAGKWHFLSPEQQAALDFVLLVVCILSHVIFATWIYSELPQPPVPINCNDIATK